MLLKSGAIKVGDFTFTSGMKSKYYIDMKKAMTQPDQLNEIAKEMSKHVRAKIVAGVELGAVPLITAVSLKMNIPFIIIRKQEREHGVKDPVIGQFKEGEEVDILEDVVTTGGSIMKAVILLRSRGAKVTRAICVANWEKGGDELLKSNGVELISIIKASELVEK